MAHKQPTNADQVRALFAANVRWHESGTLSQGNGREKIHLFAYFKCDRLTEAQRAILTSTCPLVEFRSASPMYAPEIRNVLVCFPKAARMRQLANA